MGSQRIRLSGINPPLTKKTWESDRLLRIGRLETLDVVIANSSISRHHAEVSFTDQGWAVRDLGSTNGTFLNGVRVGRVDQKLQHKDYLQFGNTELAVSIFEESCTASATPQAISVPDLSGKDRNLFLQVVTALTQAVELRDKYTGSHTQRVTDYALMLAKELGLPQAELRKIQIGAPLHDIGKIGIDDAILRKSSKLTKEEYESMKAHTLRGAAILETIPDLAHIIPIVRSHHERWDGKGYPDGLVGEKIPLLARIVAIADAFDAMISNRPYRSGLTMEKAFTELKDQAGTAYDPACIEAFLRLRPRIEEGFQQRDASSQTVLQLTELAYYDSLTGLPNRRLFEDRLGQILAHARRHEQMAAVLFLDLDGFKRINDTLGHHVGDRVLHLVGQRLKGCIRESDTVARLGGDEFTIILADIALDQDALEVAQKILKTFVNPFVVNEHEVMLSPSIGISVYPADGADVESLVKRADLAMYQAKEKGKNNCQLYNQSMNTIASEHLAQKNRLQEAIDQEELVVHYQPVVDLGSGAIVGVEGLVRWQHPKLGLLPPAQFIPLAEESGLIVPVGNRILQAACAQQKAWKKEGLAPLRVAVNLSARQFRHKTLPETIAQVLKDTKLEPSCLVLEITECALIQFVDEAIARLTELKNLGVQLLVDGFGSGQSSFSILKRLPIDILKIDPSFIRGLPADRGDSAIMTALITLAHSLDLKVIAKHVETEDQLMFLRSQNCDEMQGFLFSHPLPGDELGRLVRGAKDQKKIPPARAKRVS